MSDKLINVGSTKSLKDITEHSSSDSTRIPSWLHEYPEADWTSGFQINKTVNSTLPYSEFTGSIEVPLKDNCAYRLIKLPNNLTVLCVQDPGAKESTAALCVNVGSSANPPELPGLAHLMEHMIYKGSEKYPSEYSYFDYLASNAGQTNAFVYMSSTCFYLNCSNTALEGALDRFSNFFLKPLFKEECIEQELRAIDSEFKGYSRSDLYRAVRMCNVAFNQQHPYAGFSSGRFTTLKTDPESSNLYLQSKLVEFFEKYYSADIMKLVITGDHSLDQLAQWAVSMFSGIKSKGNTKPITQIHPLGKGELGKLVHYKPVSDVRYIRFMFALPEIKALFRSGIIHYVRSMLNRQESGSLIYYLRRKDWATDINVETEAITTDNFNILYIDISATNHGIDDYRNVVKTVFAYLQKISNIKSDTLEYLKELRVIKSLNFDNFEKPSRTKWASDLVCFIHNEYLSPKHTVSRDLVMDEPNIPVIREFMSYLNSQNYTLLIEAKDVNGVNYDRKEKYYDIEYNIDELPSEISNELKINRQMFDAFSTPKKNIFIPTQLDVINTRETHLSNDGCCGPVTLVSKPGLNVYYSNDSRFCVPRGSTRLLVDLKNMKQDPFASVLFDLYILHANKTIREEFHQTLCAGLEFSVKRNRSAIEIIIDGFSDKQSLLLTSIIDKLTKLSVDETMFNVYLAILHNDYTNENGQRSWKQGALELQCINEQFTWDHATSLQQCNKLSIQALQALCDHIFDNVHCTLYMCGNFPPEYVCDTACDLELLLPKLGHGNRQGEKLDNYSICPGYYVHSSENPDHDQKNCAALCYIYCGDVRDRRNANTLLLIHRLLKTEFVSQLRTKEMLGYTVNCSVKNINYVRDALAFKVEGESNPVFLAMRISEFIREFRKTLAEISDEKLRVQIGLLLKTYYSMRDSIKKDANYYWPCILSGECNLRNVKLNSKCLTDITKQSVLAFWDRYINPETSKQYTRVDSLVWSGIFKMPRVEEFETYSKCVISLHACLYQAGLKDYSIKNVHDSIVEYIQASKMPTSTEDELFENIVAAFSDKVILDGTDSKPLSLYSRLQCASQMIFKETRMRLNYSQPDDSAMGTYNNIVVAPDGCRLVCDIGELKRYFTDIK